LLILKGRLTEEEIRDKIEPERRKEIRERSEHLAAAGSYSSSYSYD